MSFAIKTNPMSISKKTIVFQPIIELYTSIMSNVHGTPISRFPPKELSDIDQHQCSIHKHRIYNPAIHFILQVSKESTVNPTDVLNWHAIEHINYNNTKNCETSITEYIIIFWPALCSRLQQEQPRTSFQNDNLWRLWCQSTCQSEGTVPYPEKLLCYKNGPTGQQRRM